MSITRTAAENDAYYLAIYKAACAAAENDRTTHADADADATRAVHADADADADRRPRGKVCRDCGSPLRAWEGHGQSGEYGMCHDCA